jgi:hypothetical protein
MQNEVLFSSGVQKNPYSATLKMCTYPMRPTSAEFACRYANPCCIVSYDHILKCIVWVSYTGTSSLRIFWSTPMGTPSCVTSGVLFAWNRRRVGFEELRVIIVLYYAIRNIPIHGPRVSEGEQEWEEWLRGVVSRHMEPGCGDVLCGIIEAPIQWWEHDVAIHEDLEWEVWLMYWL